MPPKGKQQSSSPRRPPHRAWRPAEELLLLQGQDRRGRLQELQPAPALRLGEGEDPLAPDHGRLPPPPGPGRGRRQARARDGAPSVRLGAVDRSMEVILLQDVEQVGLRGDVVNVARGYMRNFLQPRGSRSRRRRRSSRSCRSARSSAPATRRATLDQAQEIAKRIGATVLRFEAKRRPARPALRLGHADGHRRRDLGARRRSASTGARSTCRRRSSGSAATRSRSRSSRT